MSEEVVLKDLSWEAVNSFVSSRARACCSPGSTLINVASGFDFHPGMSVEEARERLYGRQEETKTRERIKQNSQAAILGTLAFVAPDLLLSLNNDSKFKDASLGT